MKKLYKYSFLIIVFVVHLKAKSQNSEIKMLSAQPIEIIGDISTGGRFYSNDPQYNSFGRYNVFLSGNLEINTALLPVRVSYDLNFSPSENGFYNKFSIQFDREKFQEKLRNQLAKKINEVESNMQDIEGVNQLVDFKNSVIQESYPKSFNTLQGAYKMMDMYSNKYTKQDLKDKITNISNVLNQENIKESTNTYNQFLNKGLIKAKDGGVLLNQLNINDSLYSKVQETISTQQQINKYKQKGKQYKKLKNNYKKLKFEKQKIQELQESSSMSFLNSEENVAKGLKSFNMLSKKIKLLNSIKDFQVLTINKKFSDLTLNNIQLLGAAATIEYEKLIHFSLVAGVDPSVAISQNQGNLLKRDANNKHLKRFIYGFRAGVGSESSDFFHLIFLSGKDKIKRGVNEVQIAPKRNSILGGIVQKTFFQNQIKIGGEFNYSVTTHNTLSDVEYNNELRKPILFKKNINATTVNDYAIRAYGNIKIKKMFFELSYAYRGNDYFSMGTYFFIPGNSLLVKFNQDIIPNRLKLNAIYVKQFAAKNVLGQKRNFDNLQVDAQLNTKKNVMSVFSFSIKNVSNKSNFEENAPENQFIPKHTLTSCLGANFSKSISFKKGTVVNVFGANYISTLKNNTIQIINAYYNMAFVSNKGFSFNPSFLYQYNKHIGIKSSSFQVQMPIAHAWKKGHTLGGGASTIYSRLKGWNWRVYIQSKLKLFKAISLDVNLGLQNSKEGASGVKKHTVTGFVAMQYQFKTKHKIIK